MAEEPMEVTPWEVKGKIDYSKLLTKFGTHEIDAKLLKRLERLAGPLHVMLRRKFVFSHRDLDKVLDDYEQGRGFFLYTGRGPSGPMHIGHLIPLLITKWFQERFKVNLYICISDDEKFLVRQLGFEEVQRWAYENILDIIAVGFDPKRTFIFKDTEYIRRLYPWALRVAKKTNLTKAKAVFGFEGTTNIGLVFYTAVQTAPTFFEQRRCLIPCAIDQDPYWRVQRDVAESFGYYKAAAVHTKFFPPLTGIEGKMSSSEDNTIWLSDGPDVVKRKVFRYAFSGGQPTVELHRKLGGRSEVDVCFQWLAIFLEEDDAKLKKIEEDYRSGALLTGELKQITIEKLNGFLEEHRARKEKAKELVDEFMYSGRLAQEMWEAERALVKGV